MKLYHATSLSKAKRIIYDGLLKCDIERIWTSEAEASEIITYGKHDLNLNTQTKNGYVYLTNDLHFAVYHGNRVARKLKEDFFVIFRIEVSESQLLPDIDELTMVYDKSYIDLTLKESLEICQCVRVKEDIPIYSSEFIIRPSRLICDIDKNMVHTYNIIKDAQRSGNELTDIQKNIMNKYYQEFKMKNPWKDINEFNAYSLAVRK